MKAAVSLLFLDNDQRLKLGRYSEMSIKLIPQNIVGIEPQNNSSSFVSLVRVRLRLRVFRISTIDPGTFFVA